MSTIEFDEEHFTKVVTVPAKRDPDVLTQEIAAKHGVRVTDMLSKHRFSHLVEARRELYAALKSWGWSYPAIGAFCGKRDHATVFRALEAPEVRAARNEVRRVAHAEH